jgi:hypothetical protein
VAAHSPHPLEVLGPPQGQHDQHKHLRPNVHTPHQRVESCFLPLEHRHPHSQPQTHKRRRESYAAAEQRQHVGPPVEHPQPERDHTQRSSDEQMAVRDSQPCRHKEDHPHCRHRRVAHRASHGRRQQPGPLLGALRPGRFGLSPERLCIANRDRPPTQGTYSRSHLGSLTTPLAFPRRRSRRCQSAHPLSASPSFVQPASSSSIAAHPARRRPRPHAQPFPLPVPKSVQAAPDVTNA